MPQQNTLNTKEKIISIFRKRGPSLPVHIAKEMELSILFASAFLSELLSEKKIQISNMKVGSSPVYFIPDQKLMLEKFSHHLKSKEKDAFILLSEKKILKDKEQEPAIRVALRAIKDFAIPFEKDQEIYWKYFNFDQGDEKKIVEESKPKEILTKEEKKNYLQNKEESKTHNALPNEKREEIIGKIVENLSKQNINKSQTINPEINLAPQAYTASLRSRHENLQAGPEKSSSKISTGGKEKEIQKKEETKIEIFNKPLEEETKIEVVEEKPGFITAILDYLKENKIKLIEETDVKKREFLGIARIESDIGEMEILILGKDKKKINEKDLVKIVEMSNENKRIVLLLSFGEIDKKAKEFFREHKNIIKFFKIG